MSHRTVLRLLAVAAWLLAAAPMATTFGAESGTAPEQGWWNKQQALPVQGDPSGLGLTTVPTVPAPPTVPADGLYVSSDGTSEPGAISALRYAAAGGGTLTLHLPEGTTLTGTEQVVACPVQGGFTPVENGSWGAKPSYDPASCVVDGTPSADAAALTFEIPASFASALGDVSIVIAPAAGATPFSVPFDKATADSFVVTAPVSSSAAGASDVPAYDAGSASYSAPGMSSSPSFSTPSSPSVAAPSAPKASGGQAAAPVLPTALPAALHHASRTDQIVAVVMLGLIGAGFWMLANRQQRLPRLLGSVGGHADAAQVEAAAAVKTTRPRGVGRFARHRTAPPTAI